MKALHCFYEEPFIFMEQVYQHYTSEDFEVWRLLFERQEQNLQNKACTRYLNCLSTLNKALNATEVPRFDKLSKELKRHNGWEIEVVPGLIPVDDFFQLLSQKKFCSSTWLRKKSQLDYLEEPDMFHDIFGHIPLLVDAQYSAFAQKLGEVGVKYSHDKTVVAQLQRLYWFTIEFGLKKGTKKTEIYGAGIMSSFGESNYIYNSSPEIKPYDFNTILQQEFRTDVIQTLYFEIESYEQLYDSLNMFDVKKSR